MYPNLPCYIGPDESTGIGKSSNRYSERDK